MKTGQQDPKMAVWAGFSPLAIPGFWGSVWERFWHYPGAYCGVALLGWNLLWLLAGPCVTGYTIDGLDWDAVQTGPTWLNQHYFGTDAVGRDMFVRTLYAGRTSLAMGCMAAGLAVLIGVLYGTTAGWMGGWIDAVMMRLVDVWYAVPFLFWVLWISLWWPDQGIWMGVVAIGTTHWLDLARIIRGQTLQLKNRLFVDAARIAGAHAGQIMGRHLIPNMMGLVLMYTSLLIPSAILTESVLGFMGLGIQEPGTSWGMLLAEGAGNMETAWWTWAFPAAFLISTLGALQGIGDSLRRACDPRA